jgi:replicative DNA helicase
MSAISGSFKALAKELDVTVLALFQVRRTDKAEPELADLRESGSIEQDADIVAFVSRNTSKNSDKSDVTSKFSIKKHRNGPLSDLTLIFNKDSSKFSSPV